MVSAARAAYRGSDTSRERLCRGRTPVRSTTRGPAVSTGRSSSSRVRGPRCPVGSDRIGRPPPAGRRSRPRPAGNPPDIPLSSSYTPVPGRRSADRAATAGSRTTRSARQEAAPSAAPPPPGCSPGATAGRPSGPGRRAGTAAWAPVPVPGSNATAAAGSCRTVVGRGASATRATYLLRVGARSRGGDGRVRAARAPRRPAPATGGHRSLPAAPAAEPATGPVRAPCREPPRKGPAVTCADQVNCRTPDACGRSVELS